MKSEMIYRVRYDAATIILNKNEMIIYYASEDGKGKSYTFNTRNELLTSYKYCISLMEYLERERIQFQEIETAHKRGLELFLEG